MREHVAGAQWTLVQRCSAGATVVTSPSAIRPELDQRPLARAALKGQRANVASLDEHESVAKSSLQQKPTLRVFAIACLTLGTLLLGTAVGVRLWAEQAAERSIVVFTAAAEAAAAHQALDIVGSARAERMPTSADGPDTRLWSPGRIRAYQKTRVLFSAVPEGLLTIPSVRVRVPVFRGTDAATLAVGAGRIEGTPALGADGNVGIAAHRDGHFRALKDIELGAEIVVETPRGIRRYEVVGTRIVRPEDVHVLDATGVPSITLVTCYPFYFVGHAPRRFIVRAERTPGEAS